MDAAAAAGQVQGPNNAAARRSMAASRSIQPLGPGPASSTPSTETRLLPTPIPPTPRHAVLEQTRAIYRIKQHQPPTTLLPHGGDASQKAIRAQIRWWEDVQNWLQYLLRAVDVSLSKTTDLRTCLEITPVGIVQRPHGLRIVNEEWNKWDAQQLNRKSCNLGTVFYGPPSLPDTNLPSVEEMRDISSFEESHKAYMLKHMGHLSHMRVLLEGLILQAELKIEGLIYKHKKWEEIPDFRRPKIPQDCAGIFPLLTAPARTMQFGVARHIHSDDEHEDFNEDSIAMATEFPTLPNDNYESFQDMGLKRRLLRGINSYGFQEPSAIQQGGIVPICLGKDVILKGQSGIGKQTSFSCGILQRIDYSLLECQALVLVHAPELAQHMKRAISGLGCYLGVKVHSCVGGKLASVQEDQRILASGVHVVVGTPGPVLDMIQESLLCPDNIKIFVLGKADALSTHTDRIYDIWRYLPSAVQVGLFSDTLSVKALEMTHKFMNKPLLVAVKIEHSLVGIQQYYLDVEKEEWKLSALLDMYEHFGITKMKSIIYVNTRDKVRLLTSQLDRMGNHKVLITRKDRLVDLRGVAYVINYDIPLEPVEYLQCIGHTKQLGNRHVAISLVTLDQKNILKDMEKIHNVVIKELPESL